MKGTVWIWLVAVVCGLAVLGALGWQSLYLLQMESQQDLARDQARQEEQARLALTRMDSVGLSILVQENRRSVEEFESWMLTGDRSEFFSERFVEEFDEAGEEQRKVGINSLVYGKPEDLVEAEAQSRGEIESVWEKGLQPKAAGAKVANFENMQRARVLQDAVQNAVAEAQVSGAVSPDSQGTEIGPFVPEWRGDELVLVRKVSKGGRKFAQVLRADVEALENEFLSVRGSDLRGGTLAKGIDSALSMVTFPFHLELGTIYSGTPSWTPLKTSLVVTWLAVSLALVAGACLLFGILRLSERRASFVSAVTHELRTPLTTFRMYSEMLADGLVRDEEKKRDYLLTMRSEADRLAHLVENVLSFSKIERGSAKATLEAITTSQLMGRFQHRLHERCDESGADLKLSNLVPELVCQTVPSAVEQIVFNLIDNGCKYGVSEDGSISLDLTISKDGRSLVLTLSDRGRGIRADERGRIFKPFHKSAQDAADDQPGVGLGLALCQRMVKELNGRLTIQDSSEGGATFRLELPV